METTVNRKKVVLIKDCYKEQIKEQIIEAKRLYKKGKYKAAAGKFTNILKKRYNPEIACSLGKCYMYGRGVSVDRKAALDLFTEASKRGYYPAYYCLGKYYEIFFEKPDDLVLNSDSNKEELEKRQKHVIDLFKKAANNGHIEAQNKVGQYYSYLPNDDTEPFSKSLEWYKKAALNNHVHAQYSLGWAYQNGKKFDIQKDYVKAAMWYKKAADQGLIKAMTALSLCYYRGKGVAKDKDKAKYWLNKAKENKTAFNKIRKIKLGDTVVNPKTGKEEMILHYCRCDSNIQCAISCEGKGYYVNEFGSHRIIPERQCYLSNKYYASITCLKAFTEKFRENDWEFKK